MPRLVPILCRRRAAIDILGRHQAILGEPLRCRRDGSYVTSLVLVALLDGTPGIAGLDALLGRLWQGNGAARKFVHGADTEAARTQVPARVSRERHLHHRHTNTSHVIA